MKHLGWMALVALGCSSSGAPGVGAAGSAAPSANEAPSAVTALPAAPTAPAPGPRAPLAVREGGALLRSPAEPVLWLADEDHGVVRRIPIEASIAELPPLPEPSTERKQITGRPFPGPADKAPDVVVHAASVPLPGKPAQVLPLADRVLVSVRDPGLLLALGNDGAELFRVSVPADAWGLAVSADARIAYVTSAWTHRVTAVDLETRAVRWSLDVAREPRGVAASADGRALYVSHLVGAALTKIADPGGASPVATRVELPPDPLGTFLGVTSTASLGYAALIGPDGRRLYVARHALGATGNGAWQGVPSVDVLYMPTDAPVAPGRERGMRGTATLAEIQQVTWRDAAGILMTDWIRDMIQPRALAYRRKTDQLLVAAEGTSTLVELDALSVAPSVEPNRVYQLGGLPPEQDPTKIQIPPRCGAPTGVALDADENVAWVFCRATNNLVAVRLEPDGKIDRSPASWRTDPPPWGPFAFAKLADDPDPGEVALGRRLFYDAVEPVVSGGLACAGCHPEGRDDGFTWHELSVGQYSNGRPAFVATPSILSQEPLPDGEARRPPRIPAADAHARRARRRRGALRLARRERHPRRAHPRRLHPAPDLDPRRRRAEHGDARRPPRRLRAPRPGAPAGAEARAVGGGAARARGLRLGDRRLRPVPRPRLRLHRSQRDAAPAAARRHRLRGREGPRLQGPLPALRRRHGALLPRRPLRHAGGAGREERGSDGQDPAAFARRPRRADRVPGDPVRAATGEATAGPGDGGGRRSAAGGERRGLAAGGPRWVVHVTVGGAPAPRRSAGRRPHAGARARGGEGAPDAGLARIGDPACSAKRVREWVRVACDRYESNVVLLAGTRDGVDFSMAHDKDGNAGGIGWVTFPVRRGDRRAILFNRFSKWGFQPDALVSEQWLEGDPGPIVVVTGDALTRALSSPAPPAQRVGAACGAAACGAPPARTLRAGR